MARYAIFACEQKYGGLHGMNTTAVVEFDSFKEVEAFAWEESLCVMDSYSCIAEELESEVREYLEDSDLDEDAIDKLRTDIYNENVDYSYALVNEEKAKGYTTEQLDTICSNIGFDNFVEEFCGN